MLSLQIYNGSIRTLLLEQMEVAMNALRFRAKRIAGCLMLALALLLTAALMPGESVPVLGATPVAAATKAQVRKAYKQQVKKLARLTPDYDHGAHYKIVDVLGNKTEELLVMTRDGGGSGSTLRIYTYANGKVKRICTTGVYGDNWYKFYRSAKGFVMHSSGHGGESYRYFKRGKSSYKLVASKGRQSVNGGSAENGPWSYYNAKGSELSKAAFTKKAKAVARGSYKKVGPSYKWTWMEG